MTRETITITFSSPQGSSESENIVETFTKSQLKLRDPNEVSRFFSRMRETNSSSFSMSPDIDENRIMGADLIRFVCNYVRTGSLICPVNVEGEECVTALDFFGFDFDINESKIKFDEEENFGKLIRWDNFIKLRKMVDSAVSQIKRKLMAADGVLRHWFVISPPCEGDEDFTLSDLMDSGGTASRFGFGSYSSRAFFDVLDTKNESAKNARALIQSKVTDFEGISSEWQKQFLLYRDGDRVRQYHVLRVNILEPNTHERGIKRKRESIED